jgi:hypothetical protein
MSKNTQQPQNSSPRAKFEARYDDRRQIGKALNIRQDPRLRFLASTDSTSDLMALVKPEDIPEGSECGVCLEVLAHTDENRKL